MERDAESSNTEPNSTPPQPASISPAPINHKPTTPAPSIRRRIVALAVPALGALIAEPIFLLVDSAIVGHLGTAQLAGLAVASTLLITVVGLAVFLAYATTAQVSRLMGAGQTAAGLRTGVDAAWLSLFIGCAAGAVAGLGAPLWVYLLGSRAEVAQAAIEYLRVGAVGIPAMLLVMALTGLVRGLQDTVTPLVVAVAGMVLNAPLIYLLVFPAHLGIAGSALGTVICQWLMAAALFAVARKATARHGVTWAFHPGGIRAAGRDGVPLFIRTLALRIGILLTTGAAVTMGTPQLAAFQVTMNVWNLLALTLDALAIAGQALTGHHLGSGDRKAVRTLTRESIKAGLIFSVPLAALVAVLAFVAPHLFTSNPAVQHAIQLTMLAMAVTQPLAAYVFVLDGILIGAGDGPYLARSGVGALALYLPVLGAVLLWAGKGTPGLLALWLAYSVGYPGLRGLFLGVRANGNDWMSIGQ